MKNSLEYNGYHAKIEMCIEDNTFFGTVIGINDSLYFHGNTIEELKEAFATCIDDYIDMCNHYGKSPDKEYKGSFNVRINPETHKKLDVIAQTQGKSLNQLISEVLDDEVSGERKSNSTYIVRFGGEWNSSEPIKGINMATNSPVHKREVNVNDNFC